VTGNITPIKPDVWPLNSKTN